ncbi:hypothetical protein PpBr36_02262 [Pyricularia pennisetigena]|uniref:hypothetical protein n=1 Tax=Pyricularia pennisetigena TaxID=1578925 RepID=UPI00115055A6|nr:hypothetical protein PpBr36_02262 [Pyricularia pennisetigena]TLS29962.1 hypothetical protein PpBr36_02262 [Pyricularia pennisetigena]
MTARRSPAPYELFPLPAHLPTRLAGSWFPSGALAGPDLGLDVGQAAAHLGDLLLQHPDEALGLGVREGDERVVRPRGWGRGRFSEHAVAQAGHGGGGVDHVRGDGALERRLDVARHVGGLGGAVVQRGGQRGGVPARIVGEVEGEGAEEGREGGFLVLLVRGAAVHDACCGVGAPGPDG